MKFKLICTILLVGVSNLFSQNYQDVIRPFQGLSGGSGAETNIVPAAMVSSAALMGNPALLSYSERAYFSTDLNLDQIEGNSVYNSAIAEKISDSEFNLNSLSYIHPVRVYRGAWVWGVGLQKVHTFTGRSEFEGVDSVSIDDNYYQYNYLHSDRESGNLYAFTFGTSGLVTMNTSLGIAVSYLRGENTFERVYRESDSHDLFSFETYTDSLRITPKYSGFGARLGLLSEFSEFLHLGLSMELPSWIAVTESSSLDQVSKNDVGIDTTAYSDSWHNLEYSVWGPWRLGIGLGFNAAPLQASINYRFHSYRSLSMNSNLLDPNNGGDLDNLISDQIDANVQNVHEYSASVIWSMDPLRLSFGATVFNDPLNYRLDDILRVDLGLGYQLKSGIGFTFALRNEKWQSDLNHTLTNGVERSVAVENNLSKFQFGIKYIL